jgi:hypothetical protein
MGSLFYSKNAGEEKIEQEFNSTEKYVHLQYSTGSNNDDIALIRLPKDAKLNGNLC